MLTVLPPAVMAFRSKVPAVRLELSESLMANAQSQLREGTMDFAITPLPASSAPQEFHCEPLLEYETAYMVRRGHPLAHSTSLHQLLEQDWVMSYTPESFDALFDEVFLRHGVRLPRQRIIQAHSFGMLQALVEFAEMCTCCPQPIAALPQFASPAAAGAAGELPAGAAEYRHSAQQHSERRRPCVYRHAGAHPAPAGAIVAAGRSPDLRSRAPADLADLPGSPIP